MLSIRKRVYSREFMAHLFLHVWRLAIDSHQASFIQESQGLVGEPLGPDVAARIQIRLEPAFRESFVDRHEMGLQALQLPLHRHHVASELSASRNEIRAC